MTYSTYRTDKTYNTSYRMAGYEWPYELRRTPARAPVPGALRLTPDYQLGGFWKEWGDKVHFVSSMSLEGRKLVAAWDLVGLPLRLRR